MNEVDKAISVLEGFVGMLCNIDNNNKDTNERYFLGEDRPKILRNYIDDLKRKIKSLYEVNNLQQSSFNELDKIINELNYELIMYKSYGIKYGIKESDMCVQQVQEAIETIRNFKNEIRDIHMIIPHESIREIYDKATKNKIGDNNEICISLIKSIRNTSCRFIQNKILNKEVDPSEVPDFFKLVQTKEEIVQNAISSGELDSKQTMKEIIELLAFSGIEDVIGKESIDSIIANTQELSNILSEMLQFYTKSVIENEVGTDAYNIKIAEQLARLYNSYAKLNNNIMRNMKKAESVSKNSWKWLALKFLIIASGIALAIAIMFFATPLLPTVISGSTLFNSGILVFIIGSIGCIINKLFNLLKRDQLNLLKTNVMVYHT